MGRKEDRKNCPGAASLSVKLCYAVMKQKVWALMVGSAMSGQYEGSLISLICMPWACSRFVPAVVCRCLILRDGKHAFSLLTSMPL